VLYVAPAVCYADDIDLYSRFVFLWARTTRIDDHTIFESKPYCRLLVHIQNFIIYIIYTDKTGNWHPLPSCCFGPPPLGTNTNGPPNETADPPRARARATRQPGVQGALVMFRPALPCRANRAAPPTTASNSKHKAHHPRVTSRRRTRSRASRERGAPLAS
jgi:hypothetical protein